MIALRDVVGLSLESRKSTTSLRPATPSPPALLFRYFAAPRTPSTTPWKIPGDKGESTSATTAIRISELVTPISVVPVFRLVDRAPDCAAEIVTAPVTRTQATMIRQGVRMVPLIARTGCRRRHATCSLGDRPGESRHGASSS